jgi:hypothetical protein
MARILGSHALPPAAFRRPGQPFDQLRAGERVNTRGSERVEDAQMTISHLQALSLVGVKVGIEMVSIR